MTAEFVGEDGVVKELRCERVDDAMQPVPGSEFTLKADLVLLAMGFVSPVREGLLEQLGVAFDPRGNVAADSGRISRRATRSSRAATCDAGQSLVVWAIREGRQCASAVDAFLMGDTNLPR